MSRLQAYLGMEDHTEETPQVNVEVEVEVEVPEVEHVTDEDVQDAIAEEVSTEELAASQRELVDSFESLRDEVDEHLASLENYAEVLSYGIEKEQYSPQFAGIVATSLERYQALFGEDVEIPALENHGHDDLGEYYTASLESVTGFMSRLSNTVTGLRNRMVEGIASKTEAASREAFVKSITKQADELYDTVSKMEGGKVKVNLKGMSARLSMGGKAPDSLAQAFTTDLKATRYLLLDYTKQYMEYTRKLSELLSTAARGDKAAIKSAADKAIGLKSPAESLPAGLLSGSDLLNHSAVKFEGRKSGEGDTRQQLKEKRKTNPAKLAKADGERGTAGEYEVTKTDAQAILKLVKQYGASLSEFDKEISKAARELQVLTVSNTKDERSTSFTTKQSWEDQVDVDLLADVAKTVGVAIPQMAKGAVSHLKDSAKTGLAVVKRISAAGKSESKDDE